MGQKAKLDWPFGVAVTVTLPTVLLVVLYPVYVATRVEFLGTICLTGFYLVSPIGFFALAGMGVLLAVAFVRGRLTPMRVGILVTCSIVVLGMLCLSGWCILNWDKIAWP